MLPSHSTLAETLAAANTQRQNRRAVATGSNVRKAQDTVEGPVSIVNMSE